MSFLKSLQFDHLHLLTIKDEYREPLLTLPLLNEYNQNHFWSAIYSIDRENAHTGVI